MPDADSEISPAPADVLVHKGRYYFCSRCNRLLTAVREACPSCHCTFAEIVDEEERIPDDPARLRKINEDYAEEKGRRFFLAATIAILVIGAVAIIVCLLAFRR